MIPAAYITAWGQVAPWPDPRQVEQDLIISRAIVEIFSDPFLQEALRFRGGTALNKLHFPSPLRYSEDIDLVRTSAGPIGPILDQLRKILGPWLGKGQFEQSDVAPKLRFRVQAENSESQIRLKIEINTREIEAFDEPLSINHAVSNPWFSGTAPVATFSREELLATKLRALLQRDKGRDLLDLAHAIEIFDDLDLQRIVAHMGRYLERSGLRISKAEAEERMFAKLGNPRFMTDIRPLLTAEAAERLSEQTIKAAFTKVFVDLIERLPGDSWANTVELKARYGISP